MRAEIRNEKGFYYFHISNNRTKVMVYPLNMLEAAEIPECFIVSRKYALYQTRINYIRMIDLMSDSDDSFDTAVPIDENGSYPYNGEAVTVYEHSVLPTGVVSYSEIKTHFEKELNRAILVATKEALAS